MFKFTVDFLKCTQSPNLTYTGTGRQQAADIFLYPAYFFIFLCRNGKVCLNCLSNSHKRSI